MKMRVNRLGSRRAFPLLLDVDSRACRQAEVVVGLVVTAADGLDEELSVFGAVLRTRLALAALAATAVELGAELVLGALLVGHARPALPGLRLRHEEGGGHRRTLQTARRAQQEKRKHQHGAFCVSSSHK